MIMDLLKPELRLILGLRSRLGLRPRLGLLLILLFCVAMFIPATTIAAENVIETEKVTVTATKSERSVDGVAASVVVITRKEIENSGSLDLNDIIKRMSGLTIQYGTFPAASSASKASISIRGIGATGTLFLQDGRRLSAEVSNPYDLNRIPASIIERIEIIKGPMSVLYGADAVGGVINIITRKPTKVLEGSVDVVSGVNTDGDADKSSGSISLRGKKKKVRYSFYANATSTQPYLERESTVTGIKTKAGSILPSSHPNPGINNIKDSYDVDVSYREESSVYTMGGRVACELFEKTRLGFDFNYFEEERDGDYRSAFFPTGISPAPGKKIPAFDTPVHSHDDNWRRDLGMDLTSSLNQDLRLNLKIYNSYYEKRNTTTALNWQDAGFASEDASASLGMNADVDVWSYEGYLVWFPGREHLLTLGGEYRDEDRVGSVFNPQGIPETRSVDYKALYIQDEWQITDSLNATLGTRYDAISNADNKVTFKVGLVQSFSKFFNLRGCFAQGYRTPNIRELYIRKNTPSGLQRGALVTDFDIGKVPGDLKPEFINSYEIGLEGRKDAFHYSAVMFYNDISDKIQEVDKNVGSPTAYTTFENISDVETMGIEIAAGYDFKSGFNINFEWYELGTEDKATGKDLTFNPERQISTTVGYTQSRFNGWVMGKYVGQQYTPNADEGWVDDYFLVDVGASYKFGKIENYEVYGGVNNLFDEKMDKLIGSNVGPYLFLGARLNF